MRNDKKAHVSPYNHNVFKIPADSRPFRKQVNRMKDERQFHAN